MKIVIFKADSSLGELLSMTFRRAGHRVISVNAEEDTKNPESYKISKDGEYLMKSQEKIIDVLKYESPDMIIYFHPEIITNEEDARNELAKMTLLVQESVNTSIKKFLYISSISVYGNQNINDENQLSPLIPITLDGKTKLACENILGNFRNDSHLQNVIFRTGDLWSSTYTSRRISQFLSAVIDNKTLTEEQRKELIVPVSQGDLADAVLKSINENIDGVYDICGIGAIRGEKLFNILYEEMNRPVSNELIFETVDIYQTCHKALHEIGWIRYHNVQDFLNHLIEQLFTYETKITPRKKSSFLKGKQFQNFIGHSLLFLVVAYIQKFQFLDTSMDLLLVFVVAAAALGGISHGIYAWFLTVCYHTYSMNTMGYGPDVLFLHYPFLIENLLYLVIAFTVGYVVEGKNSSILKFKSEAHLLVDENERLYEINGELAKSKQYQEQKLIGYENGISKLYSVYDILELKSVMEILLNIPQVVQQLTDEKNISVYIVQKKSGFVRRFAYMGKESSLIPSTFRYVNIEDYRKIIDTKQVYMNRYVEKEMPSMIIPVIVNGEVIAITVLEDYPLEKFTRYYLNLIQISGKIINNFCQKASDFQEVIAEIIYEPNTIILKNKFFESSYDNALRASKNSKFNFTVLEIPSSAEDQLKVNLIRNKLRDTDEIGRLKNGNIGVLLYGTHKENAFIVQNRIAEIGIESAIL